MKRRSLLAVGLLCALCIGLLPDDAMSYGANLPYPGRSLPSPVDMAELGMYWIQDEVGVENPSDPASLVALMEDQAARFFDFGRIAIAVAGPQYVQMNMIERAHFQNRIRDELFLELARQFGFFDQRPPQFQVMPPTQTGVDTGLTGVELVYPSGARVHLMFYFYNTPLGWRIYQITSNGVPATEFLRARLLQPWRRQQR